MTLFHAEQNEGLRLYFFSWVPLILLATLLAACLIVSKFSIRIDCLTLSAVLTGPLLTVAGLGLVSSRRLSILMENFDTMRQAASSVASKMSGTQEKK